MVMEKWGVGEWKSYAFCWLEKSSLCTGAVFNRYTLDDKKNNYWLNWLQEKIEQIEASDV